MAKKTPFDESSVLLLNPATCGINKDGDTRYKIDPQSHKRTTLIDNQLGDHVATLLAGENPPGAVRVKLHEVFAKGVLVPRYYDRRLDSDYENLCARERLNSVSLGDLEDEGVISVAGGHGSPSSDVRTGDIPYVKVSDIRSLRVNVNPTNLVPLTVATSLWRGDESGLMAWDLITPNRASSNIGEFAVLLPGEERIVLTKEVCVLRVLNMKGGWTWSYLLWALCLKAVRKQWNRIALMQTNREDVGQRYREIRIPKPHGAEWAAKVSAPFRIYFTTLAAARTAFLSELGRELTYEYIASARSVGSISAQQLKALESELT